MSTALHLARPAHLEKLLPLVAAFHDEMGIALDDDTRQAALAPLLEGSPYGAVYLIGPVSAPIGYVVVTFGWSLEFGGIDGVIDEIFIRPGVRGRGIATEVMRTLPRALTDAGLRALHLEVDREDASAQRLYARTGFTARPRYMRMSRTLS